MIKNRTPECVSLIMWLALLLTTIVSALDPPAFVLEKNDQRLLSAKEGTIYYTTDGSDPRGDANKPSKSAKVAEAPTITSATFLPGGSECGLWVPDSSKHDGAWILPTYKDNTWEKVTPPIGYDEEDTYIPHIKHDVKEAMLGKRGSVYLRWTFDLAEVPKYDEIFLDVKCDDGFAAFINGQRVSSSNAPGALDWQSEAKDKANDGVAIEFSPMILKSGATGLKKGTNVLAVQALNDGLTSSDFLFDARLRGRSQSGGTVVWDPASPIPLVARVYHKNEWSEAIHVPLPAASSPANDGKEWSHFLGPNGNAVYTGPPLLTDWPDEGPKKVWQHEVGAGHASPVVADGKLIVLYLSVRRNFAVDCLDAKTGKEIWSKKYLTTFKDKSGYDHGPRGTPTIAGDRVVFSFPDGLLACLDMEDGRELWKLKLKEQFETDSTWHGFLASPLVASGNAILPVGAEDAGIVAFSMKDGSVQWKVSSDEVCGVSPRHFQDDQVLVTTRSHVRCLNPATGTEHWSYRGPKSSSGNPLCASPLIYGDEIFHSGWYGIGLHRTRVTNETPTPVWNREDLLSSHYASLIQHNGYLYGYHGHATEGPTLRCVKIATREVMWEEDLGSSGTITQLDDQLLILADQGELMLVPASPEKCNITHRVQVTRRFTRNFPAIADGLVYMKGPRRLVCLDMQEAK